MPADESQNKKDRIVAIWSRTLGATGWEGVDPGASLRSRDDAGPGPAPDTLSGGPTAGGASDTLSGGPTAGGADRSRSDAATAGAPAAPAGRDSLIDSVTRNLPRLSGADYEMVDELARGGMGVVYRARQRCLAREVAVKRILDRAGDDEHLRRRFVSESLVTGLLDHPNIVPVHELAYGDGGEIYLAMKLVSGLPWSRLLHPGTDDERRRAAELDLRRHLEILIDVCNAVAFAHDKGILHRDLKPENVMVGEFGEVLVMDWGIAVDMRARPGEESRAPHVASVRKPAGTPHYLAPEMAESRTADFGPATDVYLLGAILHEIVTGRPPHAGGTLVEVLLAAAEARPPSFPPDVPTGLAAICRRALARDPRERHPSVAAFQQALRDFLTHRESERIAAHAREILAGCREADPADEAARSALYARYAEAVAGFQQAAALWAENPEAESGAGEARRAYAEAALAAGDLGLAEAQARPIARTRDGAALLERVRGAQNEARRREAQRRRLRWSLYSAVAVIVVGLTIGTVLVTAAQRRTAAALANETEAREAETTQRRRADAAAVTAREEARRAVAQEWRSRLRYAAQLYRRGLNRFAEEEFAEAGAYLLRAYLTAPAGAAPEGFTPEPGRPASAVFAWTALGMVEFDNEQPANLGLPAGEFVRGLRYDRDGNLLVATTRRLLRYDVEEQRVRDRLDLPCRSFSRAGDYLVVVCSDRPPQVVHEATWRVVNTLYDERERDIYTVRTDEGAGYAFLYDSKARAVLVWKLGEPGPRSFLTCRDQRKWPADFFVGEGTVSIDGEKDRPPAFPPTGPYGQQTYHKWKYGKEKYASWIFRSPNGAVAVQTRNKHGDISLHRIKPYQPAIRNLPWVGAKSYDGLGGVSDDSRLLLLSPQGLLALRLEPFSMLHRRDLPFGDRMRACAVRGDCRQFAYSLDDTSGFSHVQIMAPGVANWANFRIVDHLLWNDGALQARPAPGPHPDWTQALFARAGGGKIGRLGGFIPCGETVVSCLLPTDCETPTVLACSRRRLLAGEAMTPAARYPFPPLFVAGHRAWAADRDDGAPELWWLGRRCADREELSRWDPNRRGLAFPMNETESLRELCREPPGRAALAILADGEEPRLIEMPGADPARRMRGMPPWPGGARRYAGGLLVHRAGDIHYLHLADGGDRHLAVRCENAPLRPTAASFAAAPAGTPLHAVVEDDGLHVLEFAAPHAFCDDAHDALAGGEDGFAGCRRVARIVPDAACALAAISPGGDRVFAVTADVSCSLYDVATGRRCWRRSNLWPLAVCFHPTRPLMVLWTAEDRYLIELVDLASGCTLSRIYPKYFKGLGNWRPTLRFVDGGTNLVVAHGRSLYDIRFFPPGAPEPPPDPERDAERIEALRRAHGCTVGPDGELDYLIRHLPEP